MDEVLAAELRKRKQPLNLAIVYVDPEAFVANYLGWLEITALVSAVRAGETATPQDGAVPQLTAQQMKSGGVVNVGNDAIFAFCMTAALRGDKAAVDKVEADLRQSLGEDFPGSVAFWNFRASLDAPISLDDFVGQAGKKMLLGDPPPPPLRAKENWSAGLRFFEKARKTNFVQEIVYPLALWHRERWTETLEKGVAFLHHIEDNVPILREALNEKRSDAAFIADLLLKAAPAVDMELTDDAQGYLRSLARRG